MHAIVFVQYASGQWVRQARFASRAVAQQRCASYRAWVVSKIVEVAPSEPGPRSHFEAEA